MVAAVSETDEEKLEEAGRKPGLWKRFVVNPVMGQLKQGISPDKLGWTISSGITLGIFPVWGTRAWLCLLTGWLFKLNQPVLHAFKSLFYPVQMLLIIPFIQVGQVIFGKPPVRISTEFLKEELSQGALAFWQEFGWVLLRAATAWLIIAPFLLLALKWGITPLLRKAGMKDRVKKEAV